MQKLDTHVDELIYGGEIAKRVETFSQLMRVGGLALVLLLGVSTLLIIVNTIRLTVIARQDEISIMKLVGATNTFIQWPFLIEGLIIGISGSLFAVFSVRFMYELGVAKIQKVYLFYR